MIVKMRENKIVVVFDVLEGWPPLVDDEVRQIPGMPDICASCPARCGGLVVGAVVEIPKEVKAEPGSKEHGCKMIDPRVIGSLSNNLVPTCFHPDRWWPYGDEELN
jgi:hypothetical protein